MKRYLLTALLLGAAVIAVFCGGTPAEEFAALFNGRDLSGWVQVNGAPETFSVSDGMIVCTGIPRCMLRTDRQYENYVLELEWRHIEEGGNAGLFIHAAPLPALGTPYTDCMEIQIKDGTQGDMFALYGMTMTPRIPHPDGRMFSVPMEERVRPHGEWNQYRVESRDGVITLSINGAVVNRAFHLNPRKGYIALEAEGSEVQFRNIRLMELPSSNPPAETTTLVADGGFRCLYNGVDLRGWRQVTGNEGHWTANDVILDYDGKSEAEAMDKHLTTVDEFQDFVLMVDWRLMNEPVAEAVPVILPDGSQSKDAAGNDLTAEVLDGGDSGIYLRGSEKAQVNMWNWPVGSGEFWGYRTDNVMSDDIRSGATPMFAADNAPGQWNRFVITLIGETVTVELNGETVIRESQLPGIPARGPIMLQHHGDHVQFANIFIKEL